MTEAFRAPTHAPIRLRYVSKPFFKRPAFIPTTITVFGISAVTGLLIFSTLQLLPRYGYLAALVALSAIVIAVWLAVFVKRWLQELGRRYTLELTNDKVNYTVEDRLARRRSMISMPYRSIEYVEMFSPRDWPVLVFHLPENRVITVQIWSMTFDPAPVLEFLLDRGVRVIHV